MDSRYKWRVEDASVREERRDTLDALVRKMFERRHHDYVEGREKAWLTAELVQSLRETSEVYRAELSTETEGPLPFALGYLQVRDGTVDLVSDRIPGTVAPKTLVLILSEFLEPGAQFWFDDGAQAQGWKITAVGEVAPLPSEEERSGENQSDSESASLGDAS